MKGVDYGDYPPTPMSAFDPNAETLPPREESHLPGPARLPSEFANTERPDPLEDIGQRLAELSDALHHEDGLVHRIFAAAEKTAAERHKQILQLVGTVSNQVAELTAIVNKLVPEQKRQAAQLQLVAGPKRGTRKRGSRHGSAAE